MNNKTSTTDSIKQQVRKERAQRRVGLDARCTQCGETRPEALIPDSDPKICAECQRKQKGKSPFDAHHVAGQNNSRITIDVPTNDHRAVLSTMQHSWPRQTLENRERNPVRAIAAWLRGAANTIVHLIDQFIIAAAEFLERLADLLDKLLGPKWWVGTTLEFATNR